MKIKLLIFLSIAFLLFVLLTPISLGSNGAYNTITRTIWCNNYSSCVHEVGHKLDHADGYPSKTWQFSVAVRMYLNDELNSDAATQMALDIFKFQFQHHPGIQNLYMSYPMVELYAEIFEMAKGKRENMPAHLAIFYNWELADKLMEKYDG